jgi:hypothetical protein
MDINKLLMQRYFLHRLSHLKTENNFMKKQLITCFALAFCLASFAQEQKTGESFPGKTSFYAEVGGPGILFSANLDTRFKKTHLGWGGRAGVGFVTIYNDSYTPGLYTPGRRNSVLTVPLQINYIFGRSASPHTFEVGGGLTVLSKKVDAFNNYYESKAAQFYGTVSFMYRRQPVNGGFTWRIGFTPLIYQGYIQPSAGASVGYSF